MSRRTQGDPGSAAGARVDQPKAGIRELVETVAAARERWIRRGYDEAAEILVGLVRRAGGEPTDVEAVAAVVLGAIASYRSEQLVFGQPPMGVPEDRFVEGLVELVAAYVAAMAFRACGQILMPAIDERLTSLAGAGGARSNPAVSCSIRPADLFSSAPYGLPSGWTPFAPA